jgi:hypothetical protein
MSQYAFCQIIANINSLLEAGGIKDQKGYTLAEWEREGFVGWDAALNTYFLQLNVGDPPAWWIIEPNGIRSFDELCLLINELFQQPPGVFHFQNVIRQT